MTMSKSGVAYLVGAGPGDPGLITVKGLSVLRSADVVVYDRLIPASLLAEARPDALLVDAGKSRGAARMSQREINELLVEYCREGKTVCRLKGGDPFVFGRGGEEALALTEAGVKWEVVPGVSSAVAAAAYAGIPVTHRGLASGVAVVTGSESPEVPASQVDWDAVAAFNGTVVVLMGWQTLPEIAEALVSRGVPGNRAAAAVEWGTTSRQRVVTASLSEITAKSRSAGLSPPVALVIGDAVSLRERLTWFDGRPLHGKRVLVTRARSQASRLAALLESEGAETIQAPAIRVAPPTDTEALDAAISNIDEYDWLTLSSPNGVRGLWNRLEALGLDSRALFGVRVAAVGAATAAALSEMGIRADLSPDVYVAEALVEEFDKTGVDGGRALCLRSDIGRETLPQGLRELGLHVEEAVAYKIEMPAESWKAARDAYDPNGPGVDATTFTSSSTVKNLVRLLDGDVDPVNRSIVACIGPITARTAEDLGIRVDVVAREQTMKGLVSALVGRLAGDTPG